MSVSGGVSKKSSKTATFSMPCRSPSMLLYRNIAYPASLQVCPFMEVLHILQVSSMSIYRNTTLCSRTLSLYMRIKHYAVDQECLCMEMIHDGVQRASNPMALLPLGPTPARPSGRPPVSRPPTTRLTTLASGRQALQVRHRCALDMHPLFSLNM